jgi:hypothetical protein
VGVARGQTMNSVRQRAWGLGLLFVLGLAESRAASLGGRVTDEVSGDPIAGATVFVLRVPFAPAGQDVTDANGDYEVTGLAAGSYLVGTQPTGYAGEVYDDVPIAQFPSAPPIVLAEDEERTDIDFALQPLRRIRGQVTRASDGAPIEGATVTAIAPDGSEAGGGSSLVDGTYEVLVTSGSYRVLAVEEGFLGEFSDDTPCHIASCERDSAAQVDANSDVSGIDFDLLAGGRLEGSVRDAVSGAAPDTTIRVQLAFGAGDLLSSTFESVLSSDGNWRSEVGLPPGSYRVLASADNGLGYRAQLFDAHDCGDESASSCAGTAADPIVVAAAQQVSGIDFDLTPTTGRLSGRVTAFADGAGLANIPVQLASDLDGGTIREVMSGSDGGFLFTGIAPGTYLVRAMPDPPLATEYFPNVQCVQPFACSFFATTLPTAISISAGVESGGVDFALAPIGAVEVTLRNTDTGAAIGGELLVERNGVLATSVESAVAGAPTDVLVPGGGSIRVAGWGRNACGAAGGQWCLGRLHPDLPCPQLQCRFLLGETIALTKGQRVTGIVLDMDVGAVITGTITAALDGQPIGNQFVEALSGNLQVATSASDGDGVYALVGLGAGPYAIRTRSVATFIDELFDDIPCPAGYCRLIDGTLLSPAIGEYRDGIDFSLAAGAHIAGIVRGTDGVNSATLPGARVSVYDELGAELATAIAATGGAFRTPALPSGRYYLKAGAEAHLTELYDDVDCGSTCSALSGTPIDLVAPADRDDIEIELNVDPSGAGGSGSGPTGPPTIVYLNRCDGGCIVRAGNNSSINDTSSIVSGSRVISEFAHGDARFEELVACVTDVFAPFNMRITASDPGNVPHHEAIVAGTPQQAGYGAGVGGVSPAACGVIDNSITFTFANTIGDNLADLCHTAAMEIAHSFGLDHEVNCEDPMTYLTGCGPKRFVDADVPCGENSPRPCQCGGTTQNSFQSLIAAVGARRQLFANGFEDDPLVLRMKREYERALAAPERFQHDFCGTHED